MDARGHDLFLAPRLAIGFNPGPRGRSQAFPADELHDSARSVSARTRRGLFSRRQSSAVRPLYATQADGSQASVSASTARPFQPWPYSGRSVSSESTFLFT